MEGERPREPQELFTPNVRTGTHEKAEKESSGLGAMQRL